MSRWVFVTASTLALVAGPIEITLKGAVGGVTLAALLLMAASVAAIFIEEGKHES